MQESHIKELVEKAIVKILSENNINEEPVSYKGEIEDGFVPDVTAGNITDELFVSNPADKDGYLAMKKYTQARLGVGRAGHRYKTKTVLRFRADHATAQDAVFSDVDEKFIEDCGFVSVATLCTDKDEYLTRPDLGKILNDKSKEILESKLKKNQKVQIVVGDGLSSSAIEANIKDIIPSLTQGLKSLGIEVNEIPFVKHCRVGAMDEIGEITNSDVICILIGERPGLATAESMSAYIAYKPTVNMPEARRTVVSNIHKGGTPAVEAGAHISEIIKLMLEKKISGVELKL
ncbi:MAG: ethanolamine ammonia-lyase subunit EutC [Lachnospirales bacterium]